MDRFNVVNIKHLFQSSVLKLLLPYINTLERAKVGSPKSKVQKTKFWNFVKAFVSLVGIINLLWSLAIEEILFVSELFSINLNLKYRIYKSNGYIYILSRSRSK